MSEAPAVLVVIVAYRSAEHLPRCLAALEAQTFTDWRAVVWENASGDRALERLSPSPRVRLVQHDENLGFAGGNNRAAALEPSRHIVTLNPDAYPEPGWLEALVAAAEETGADAVGSLQIAAEDRDRLDGAGDCMSVAGIAWRGGYDRAVAEAPAERSEIFAPCAAAALYRRDVFERLGGFDERFFCYCEDVDLGFRIRLAGGFCVLEPRAVVRHVGSGSSGARSEFAEFHGARNRLWAFWKNMPAALLPLALPAHALVTAYVLARSPALLKPRLRGVREGLAGLGRLRRTRPAPGAVRALLPILTWSPAALSRRAIKARPLRLGAAKAAHGQGSIGARAELG